MTPEQRLLVPGIERGREDLIVAGTLITIRTMERFGFESLTVSETGLLEGLLLTLQTDIAEFPSNDRAWFWVQENQPVSC